MITRRKLHKIVAGSTLLASPLAHLFAASNGLMAQQDRPLHLLYETKAADYGWQHGLAGETFDVVHLIDGDVTAVWYEKLHPLWSKQAILTAGLTRESEFFVIKTLARDYDYIVVKEMMVEEPHLVSWLLAPK